MLASGSSHHLESPADQAKRRANEAEKKSALAQARRQKSIKAKEKKELKAQAKNQKAQESLREKNREKNLSIKSTKVDHGVDKEDSGKGENANETDISDGLSLSGSQTLSEVPDDPQVKVIPNVEYKESACELCQAKIVDLVETLELRSFVPFILLIAYTAIGAGIFMYIEKPNDLSVKHKKKQTMVLERNLYLGHLIWLFNDTLYSYNRSLASSEENLYEVFAKLDDLLTTYETNAKIKFPSDDTVWHIWNALLYAGTIYTTIGYGNVHCVTRAGRILTIFYALFGIPLMLSTMNSLGKFLLGIIGKICARIGYVYSKTKGFIQKS